MARLFDSAQSQQLHLASSPVSAPPLSIGVRGKMSSFAGNPYLVSLGASAATQWFGVTFNTSGNLRAVHSDGSSTGTAVHGAAISTGAWFAGVAVFASNSSRSINANAGTKVTNATAVSAFTPGMFTIGAYRDGAVGSSNYTSGDLAEIAVWSVALDDDEQLAYQKGVDPELIRPGSLLGVWGIEGNSSPERDRWRNRYDLLVVNAPPKSDHPATFRAVGPRATEPSAAYRIAATAGDYAVTGIAASFRRTLKIAAAAGSYAVAGTAAALKAARIFSAAAGSYATTGAAANIFKSFVMAAAAGTYALTGSAATFRRMLRLAADVGSYLVSGVVASLRKATPTTITIHVDGVDVTPLIEMTTVRKEETADTLTSNTLSFEYYGDTPPAAFAEVTMTRELSDIEFAGTVLRVKQFYGGMRHNIGWRVSCQDYTWLFNDERYSYKWAGAVSATTIAQETIAFKSGFTDTLVEASLATVTDFEVINKTRGEILQLLAAQIGATAKILYDLDVSFRVTPSAADLPTDITDVTRSGDQLLHDVDGGQVRTRQRGLGVRVRIPALIPTGSTTVAVEAVDLLPSSGMLQVGSRTLTFTAQSQTQTPSGIAGVAGAPSVALASTPAGGVIGAVRYCVTFETPDGETPPGTQSAQVTGATIAAPAAGSAAVQHDTNTSQGGSPLDFISSSITATRSGTTLSFTLSGCVVGTRVRLFGGTTGSYDGSWTIGAVSGSTVSILGVSSSGASSESVNVQKITTGPHVGTFNYKFGWISPEGISALSSAFSVSPTVNATTVTATPTQTTGGNLTTSGAYYYFYTIITDEGEGPVNTLASIGLTGANNAVSLAVSQLGNLINWDDFRAQGFNIYRGGSGLQVPRLLASYSREALRALNAFAGSGFTHLDTTADTALGGLPTTSAIGAAIGISSLPSWSDGRVTGLAVLRTTAGGSTYYLHSIIGSASVTSLLDTMTDAELLQQSPVPTTSFGGHSVSLTGIATLSGATARNIYRLFNGVWRYCGTIPDNTTTTFTDAKADSELGAPIKIAGYLTGITATTDDIIAGEIGRLLVIRNDLAAQAVVLAALGRGDGVHEGPVIDDDTLLQDGLEAACDAALDTFSASLKAVTFRSRDVNLQPGKTITITLGGTTNISGTFLIQRVITSEFERADGLSPLRQVTAGPVLTTLRKTLAA